MILIMFPHGLELCSIQRASEIPPELPDFLVVGQWGKLAKTCRLDRAENGCHQFIYIDAELNGGERAFFVWRGKALS